MHLTTISITYAISEWVTYFLPRLPVYFSKCAGFHCSREFSLWLQKQNIYCFDIGVIADRIHKEDTFLKNVKRTLYNCHTNSVLDGNKSSLYARNFTCLCPFFTQKQLFLFLIQHDIVNTTVIEA